MRCIVIALLASAVAFVVIDDPNDNAFLSHLDDKNITYSSPSDAVAAAQLVCSKIRGGETPTQVTQDVMSSSNLDAYHAGFFVGVSCAAYCRNLWSQ